MKKFIVKILVLLTVFTAVLGVGAACKDKAPGKPVEHVITFYVDGEEYATLSTSGNEGLTLPENPQKTGFEFDGWYMGSEQNIPFSKDSFTSEP